MFINFRTRIVSVGLAVVLVGAQTLAPLSALIPRVGASPICTVDTSGANDVPGQKDLTKLCVDYANKPVSIQTTWNWDELGTSGGNTMDACNLFDTDGDGNVNYAVCVSTKNNPASLQSVTTYSCGDTKYDRCTSSTTAVANGSTSCAVSQQNTDPFASDSAYPADTQGQCTIDLSAVGGSSATLIDVCSYPSSEPNSDPSDCVIARSDSAKLTVVKALVPNSDTGRFDLKIDGTTYATNVGDGGTTGTQIVTVNPQTPTHTVLEQADSSTSLTSLGNYTTSVVCKDLHGTGQTVGSSNPTGTSTRQLSVTVAEDSDVVCTFTNTRATGSITVTKQVTNDNGGKAAASDFPLYVNQTPVTSGTTNAFNSNQSYTVSESGGPSGYTQTSLTCSDTNTQTLLGVTFTLAAGQNVSCIIANNDQPGTLIVKKVVVNDNGGTKLAQNFSFNVNGGDATAFNANGENDLTVNAGTYTVAETADSGYATTYDNCSNVAVANGGSATCTITNNDVAPSLTLVKQVHNQYGGQAVASDWTLTASGPTTISGAGGATSDSTFKAGTYALGESAGPSGYQAGGWDCTNGVAVTNDEITLANGQMTTCTITNSDVMPILTLVKQVSNPYGTPLAPSAFPLFVGDTQVASGAATGFHAGVYTISETQRTGYSFSGISGDCTLNDNVISILLGVGDTKTCTLTNTAIQPKLIVKKHVVNDNGGKAVASSFTMTVSGNATTVPNFAGDESGTTIYLNEGSYSVGELSHDGYAESLSADCSGVVAIGETKTCTVTNNDVAPTLTVIKHVVNDYNGTSAANNFTMTVDGTNVSNGSFPGDENGTQVTLDAGSYSVSESGPSGYTASYSSDCSGTIAVGEGKTCTVTNTAQAGTLVVKKVVANTYGGTATASDFSFSINGGNAIGFNANGENDLTVGAGTYTVAETSAHGYNATYDNCTGVTVANGATATCTITNSDIPAQLTVVKEASPSSTQSFDFTSSELGTFSLTGDGSANSSHTFTALSAGDYTFAESPTSNWVADGIWCDNDTNSDSNDTMSVHLNIADDVTCYVYNYELNTITGNKFEDSNNNGQWDNAEPGLQGWTIQLTKDCTEEEFAAIDGGQGCESTVIASTQTDAAGTYSFTGLYPGEYTACEVLQAGWIQTYPADNNGCHTFYVEGDGQTVSDVNFGNFKEGEVTGIKFNDVNGNGKRDSGEPTLSNWQITLTKLCVVSGANITNIASCADTVIGTTTTDATGTYSFGDLAPGAYKVCETMQPDKWTQTYPGTSDGCTAFTVATSGQVVTADFGNHPKPQVLGEELVNTGANASLNVTLGLAILGALAALWLLGARRSNSTR